MNTKTATPAPLMVAASWHIAGGIPLDEITSNTSPWYVAPQLRDAYLSYATNAASFASKLSGLDLLENHQAAAAATIRAEHWWGELTSSGQWREHRLNLQDIEAVCQAHGVSSRGIWAHWAALRAATWDVQTAAGNDAAEAVRVSESTCACCGETDFNLVHLRLNQPVKALNGHRLCDPCTAAITAQLAEPKRTAAAAWLKAQS